MRPSLCLNKNDLNRNPSSILGLPDLLNYLNNSNLFDISYHTDVLNVYRGETASIIYYNGGKIYLDTWEYFAPTYTKEVLEENFDLIIKLQHYTYDTNRYLEVCKKKNILSNVSDERKIKFFQKIIPWTFFCSRVVRHFVGKEETIKPLPIESLGFFCGKPWKCRKKIMEKLSDNGIECISSNQEDLSKRPLDDAEYLKKMMASKYGIVLRGRGSLLTEGKNRREIDYMILKKPLLLNYRPCYYNPMIEGVHYIYIDENTDIKTLEQKYNINQIAQNGFQWYLDNAHPIGVAKSFIQIMKEKLNA